MTSIVERKSIEKIIQEADIKDLLSNIERAFTSYSDGTAVVPPVGTLSFEKPAGDVHIKYGYIKNKENYVIKIASGFYDNATVGLPTGNGLNLVFSQKTGLLETILMDEGHLTDIRTALGGAVVAKHLAPPSVGTIGIVGTGIQARLQLLYLKEIVSSKEAYIWGRSEDKLDLFCEDMAGSGFDFRTTLDPSDITQNCNLIVTTTASTKPILSGPCIPGTLITAIGADTIGKQELATDIVKNADLLVVDSTSQCEDHGEIHKAFQSGLIKNELLELGTVISNAHFVRRPEDMIVADLTGIATQDIQISKFVLDQLNNGE